LRALALAMGLAAVSAFGSLPQVAPAPAPAAMARVDLGEKLAAFYRDRDFRPLWVEGQRLRPEARQVLAMVLGTSWDNPELRAAVSAAGDGDPRRLTRADLLLTRAYAGFVRDHQRPPQHSEIRYIDAGLAPAERDLRSIVEALVTAPSMARRIEAEERINPPLDGLQRGLAAYRAAWSRLPQLRLPPQPSAAALRRRLGLRAEAPQAALAERVRAFQRVHGLPLTAAADAATIAALNLGAGHYERLILANIERARAIPAAPGRRYILVDAASARLWMIEDGRIAGSMRVVVGKRAMPTPAMAGLIRYAVLNPYWNLPPDLIRERARKALSRGAGAIHAERLQILSDWGPRPRELDARQVDWRAVAAGRRYVNLRQRPGPRNMMGAVKFMMPNDVGVYLHDTPHRDLLRRQDRHLSSGCVRLEDAPRLARWLFGGRPPPPSGAPEQRVDLPEAVPVYIAYFTALPTREGVVFQPDPYGRDRPLLAALATTG
jgi:murein L,D-transpeptidase YcbB/YkuD